MCLPVSYAQLKKESFQLYLETEKIFEQHFNIFKENRFLLSVSGGADSTALVILFNMLRKKKPLYIKAAHIDHGLRSESKKDAEFTATLCSRLEIECEIHFLNVAEFAKEQNCGLEEAGRTARHNILKKIIYKDNLSHIILGHHAGDLAEDILMRMIRGCGWPALGGMQVLDKCFFRPFLYTDPAALRAFLLRENIPWREDESNKDLQFLRNRIRHKFVPLLLQENPSIFSSFSNINNLAFLDNDYFESKIKNLSDTFFKQINTASIFLENRQLNSLHPSIRLRLYHKAVKTVCNNKQGGQGRAKTFYSLDQAFISKTINKSFQFPGGIYAKIEKKGILFQKKA